MSFGPNPWQQRSWDWRAAGNFMCGGAGSGLIAFAAFGGAPPWALAAGAALVGLGLFSVWLEIGRPLRAFNVFFNARSSWMTREAMVAPLLFAAVAASLFGLVHGRVAAFASALLALAFVYCQGRLLQAAKGIPAWREPMLVPLIVATGLAEGGGLLLLLSAIAGTRLPALHFGFGLVLVARLALWLGWRRRIAVAPRAAQAIDAAGRVFKAATLLPLAGVVIAALAPLQPAPALALQALIGLLAAAGGLWFKFTLVTRGAFNQGFALKRLPVRGVRRTS